MDAADAAAVADRRPGPLSSGGWSGILAGWAGNQGTRRQGSGGTAMSNAKARWDEVGSALDGLALRIKLHAQQAASEAGEPSDDVDSAVSDASKRARGRGRPGCAGRRSDVARPGRARRRVPRSARRSAEPCRRRSTGSDGSCSAPASRTAPARDAAAYAGDLDHEGRTRDYRRVLFTGEHSQLVVMTLQPGEEIGEEIHEEDQTLRRARRVGPGDHRRGRAPGRRALRLRRAGRGDAQRRRRADPTSCDWSPCTHRRTTRPARSTTPRPRPTWRRRPSSRLVRLARPRGVGSA